MNKKYAGTNRLTHPETVKIDNVIAGSKGTGKRKMPLVDALLTPYSTDSISPSFEVSKEMHQRAKETIESGIQLFIDHSHKLAVELAEHDTMRIEVQREINRGPRRTSGRII